MATRLLLLRHPCPGSNLAGRLLGSTDWELDEGGRRAAQVLAERLRPWHPEACVASPLARCRQTVEGIRQQRRACGQRMVPVRFDEQLREIDFGRWENRTWEEVAAEDPQRAGQWAEYDPQFAFPGGESLADFAARVRAVAGRLTVHPAGTLLVVSHGGVIRALICHYLGLAPRQYLLFEVSYGGLVVLDVFGSQGVLKLA